MSIANKPAQKPKRERRRFWDRGRIMFYSAVLAVLWTGPGVVAAWTAVRKKPQHLTLPLSSKTIAFEPVSFNSKDGTLLKGWFIPAKDKHPRATIVLCHGVDSIRTAMLTPAQILHDAGFACILFDFRARGESGGERCTLGFREVDDALAAANYARSRPDCAGKPVGILGESMGGAVAIMAAARDKKLFAVVAESPFARLSQATTNHFGKAFGPLGPAFALPAMWFGERMIGASSSQVAPVDEVKNIAPRPLLIIDDQVDRLCPPSEASLLKEAAGSNCEVWCVPGADHIQAQLTQPDEYKRRVVTHFQRALDNAEHNQKLN